MKRCKFDPLALHIQLYSVQPDTQNYPDLFFDREKVKYTNTDRERVCVGGGGGGGRNLSSLLKMRRCKFYPLLLHIRLYSVQPDTQNNFNTTGNTMIYCATIIIHCDVNYSQEAFRPRACQRIAVCSDKFLKHFDAVLVTQVNKD